MKVVNRIDGIAEACGNNEHIEDEMCSIIEAAGYVGNLPARPCIAHQEIIMKQHIYHNQLFLMKAIEAIVVKPWLPNVSASKAARHRLGSPRRCYQKFECRPTLV